MAIAAAALAALGWTTVSISSGGFSYEGSFTPRFTTALAIATGVSLVAVVAPEFPRHRPTRLVAAAALALVVALSPRGSLRDGLILAGLTLIFMAAWPRFVRHAATAEHGVFAMIRRAATATTCLLFVGLIMAGSVGVGGGQAWAQTDGAASAPRCTADDIGVVAGGPIDLESNTGAPQAEFDLRSGAQSLDYVVANPSPDRRVVSLGLVGADPFGAVQRDYELLDHLIVDPVGTAAGSIDVSQRNGLGMVVVTAPGGAQTMMLAPGVATIRLTVADIGGTLICESDVLVRLVISPWNTPVGLAGVAAVIIGGSGLGALLLQRRLVLNRDQSWIALEAPGDADMGGRIGLDEPIRLIQGVAQRLSVNVSFFNPDVNEEKLKELARDGKLTLGELSSVLVTTHDVALNPDGKGMTVDLELLAVEIDHDHTIHVGIEDYRISLRTASVKATEPPLAEPIDLTDEPESADAAPSRNGAS